MKRILFAYPEVAPLFLNGGIGSFVCEAATLLAASGEWEVDVLTDTRYGGASMREAFVHAAATFRERGVRLMDLTGEPSPFFTGGSTSLERAGRYSAHVTRLHRERQYDVIEFPDWQAPGFWLVQRKLAEGEFADTRLIVHLHSSTGAVDVWNGRETPGREGRIARVMEEFVLAWADVVVSPSGYLLASAARAPTEQPLLRCGYPIAESPVKGSAPTRARAGVSIACVGRLEPRKGQDLLARVLTRLLDDPELPAIHCSFRGKDNFGIPPDDRMSDTLRRILGRRKGWAILPAIERAEVRNWLAADVDVCVVPSRGDNYPNVVLEAAAAGCQLVCSDAGGIPDLLSDYETGALVFPAGDEAALERQLRAAIQTVLRNPRRRERIGRRFEESRRAHALRFLAHYEAIAGLPLRSVPTLLAAPEADTGYPARRASEVVERLTVAAARLPIDPRPLPSWRTLIRAARKLAASVGERRRRALWRSRHGPGADIHTSHPAATHEVGVPAADRHPNR